MKREPFYEPLMTTHLQQMLFIPFLYKQIEDGEIVNTHTNKTRTPRKSKVVNKLSRAKY